MAHYLPAGRGGVAAPAFLPASTVPMFAFLDELLATLRATAFPHGVEGFGLVLLIVAVLAWLLPRDRWALLAPVLLFALLYPLLSLVRLLFADTTTLHSLFDHGGMFFYLAALSRAIFLLFEVGVLERIGRPLPKIALDVALGVILLTVLLVVLADAGVNATTLVTGSAVLGAGLTFAMRDTLGNLIAGIIFQMQKPFAVGDWIQYDDKPHHIGKVVEINWRETRVVTLDDAELSLPNGTLAIAYVRNFSRPFGWSRRSLYFVTPYDVPPHTVQEIILKAIEGSFGVLAEPPASVVTNAFTERGIEYWVRFYTSEFGRRDKVDGQARDRIWYALERAGITMPVATRAVRLTEYPPPQPESVEAQRARRERLLRQVDVLGVCPEASIRRVAGRVREVLYGRGEVILRQGDAGASLYLIETGEVAVSASHNGQPAVEIDRLRAGQFFGEMSLLTGAARVATVTAVTECRLLEVDHAAFEEELATNPKLAEALGNLLETRQRALHARLDEADPTPDEPKKDFFRLIREFFSLS